MKTKLLLLLFVLVALVCTFASCAGEAETTAESTTTAPVVTTTAPVTTTPLDGDDPMAAYEYVLKKMNSLGGYEATIIEEHDLGLEETTVKSTVKVNLLDGKKGFISTRINKEFESVHMTYIDGTVYCLVKATGMDIKYKTTDRAVTLAFDELFAELEEKGKDNDPESVAFVKRENGSCLFQATFSKAVGRKILFENYEGANPSAYSDIAYTAEFECNADGYITDITYKLFFTVNGMACSFITETTYHNVGTVPEVTAPADAYSYVDESELE